MPQNWDIPVATGIHMPHAAATEGMATPASLSLCGAGCVHACAAVVPVAWCQARMLLTLSCSVCCLATRKSQCPTPLSQPFHPPPLSTVKNESLSCSETVSGAAVLQLSVYCKVDSGKRIYIASETWACLSVKLRLQFGCLSFGRLHCSWPTKGGAVALRNGDDYFTAPKLMQKEELARHISGLECRTAEGTVLSVRRMPVENRNALQLKRLKFFLKGSYIQKGGSSMLLIL